MLSSSFLAGEKFNFIFGIQSHKVVTNEYISPPSSMLQYSGLNSTQVLDDYRDQVLYSGEFSDAAAAVEKLGSALGGLKIVPNAVGLGAFIISIILETVGKTLGKETMGTAEMLQRVFAQEKANEVRPPDLFLMSYF